jgi:hypothetical protein
MNDRAIPSIDVNEVEIEEGSLGRDSIKDKIKGPLVVRADRYCKGVLRVMGSFAF